ncbi:MAG: chitobiase/beta-hexosaminidase C-terminal domain-containing protein [Akkermansia muciniphila]
MRRLNRPITTQKLRLRITGSQATPCISEFSLFRQPAGAVRPSIFRRGDNLVIIADGKNKILYTTDGSEPKAGSPVYSQGAKLRSAALSKPAANSPTVNWVPSARPSASAKPDGK